MRQNRYQLSRRSTLAAMEQALQLVGGHFGAAAKLCDLEPWRFRNFLNNAPELKARWGRKRGRPPGQSRFKIKPYDDPASRWANSGVGFMTQVLSKLAPDQRRQVRDWLCSRCPV